MATIATVVPSPTIGPQIISRINFDDELRTNDMDNATRLVQAFGDSIRYCHEQKTWYVWTGKVWEADGELDLIELMKQVAEEMWVRAGINEDETLSKWAARSRSRGTIEASIGLAKSKPEIQVCLDDFDRSLYLLNFKNGTLNLETRTFQPHSNADMLTKSVGYDYDPDAKCPLWNNFMAEIFPGQHQEVIPFLQSAAGYSLTGFTGERCLFLLHGIGANGKSVFLDGLRNLLGNQYATNASWDSFTYSKGGMSIREDIARLAGARFVSATESAQNVKFAENLVKALTGGTDRITARHLYKGSFEFRPQFKLWLATNHKPNVSPDNAMWDRIRLVPFTVRIPDEKQDKNLAEKLKAEAAGIMNWAIVGLQKYLLEGLPKIREIDEATLAYRSDQDQVNNFLSANCIAGDNASVTSLKLYNAYKTWADDSGERFIMSAKEFKESLSGRGMKSMHRKSGQTWIGIGLTDNESVERMTESEHDLEECKHKEVF